MCAVVLGADHSISLYHSQSTFEGRMREGNLQKVNSGERRTQCS